MQRIVSEQHSRASVARAVPSRAKAVLLKISLEEQRRNCYLQIAAARTGREGRCLRECYQQTRARTELHTSTAKTGLKSLVSIKISNDPVEVKAEVSYV